MTRHGWHDPFPPIEGVRWQARTAKQPWTLYRGYLLVYERSGKTPGAFRFFVYRRVFGSDDVLIGRALTAQAAIDFAMADDQVRA
jgi:hypothetical protein